MRNQILVTNYKKEIFNKPFSEVYPNHTITYSDNEMVINGSLHCHVFDKLPTLRNTDNNKQWFKKDLFHLQAK